MIKPGIYFNFTEEQYFAIKAFNSSGVKDINVSPLTYQRKRDNEYKATPALIDGKAYHSYILRGLEHFQANYAIKPEGMKFSTTAGKEWKEQHAQYEIIKKETHDHILETNKMIIAHGYSGIFEAGFPEVVIIWEDEGSGVLCKAMIDWLRYNWIIDMKTFENKKNLPPKVAASNEVANHRLYIQAVFYMKGIEKIRQMLRKGTAEIDGNDKQKAWIKDSGFLDDTPFRFAHMFRQKGDVPNVICREFARLDSSSMKKNEYWTLGETHINHAFTEYMNCVETFGDTDKPWIYPERIEPYRDEEFPIYMFD